jgi:hypothetical protein
MTVVSDVDEVIDDEVTGSQLYVGALPQAPNAEADFEHHRVIGLVSLHVDGEERDAAH